MIKKIAIEELQTGMYLSGLEKEEGKTLFFMNNIFLKTAEDITRFRRNGYISAYIETEPGFSAPPGAPKKGDEEAPSEEAPIEELLTAEEPVTVIPEVSPVEPLAEEVCLEAAPSEKIEERPAEEAASEEFITKDGPIIFKEPDVEEKKEEKAGIADIVEFREELKEAKKIRSEAESLVKDFMTSLKLEGEIKAEKVHETVGKMVDSIFRNQDALTSLSRLKSFDNYTFTHSVNVSILAIAIGRHAGVKKESLHDLGVGAILHDIGKMLVPETILNKPGALTDAEFAEMKKHTAFAADILADTQDISDTSRRVAMEHHEKFDGSGYHSKLSGKDINYFARIAAVADVYDAMTSNRVYTKGMPPEEALKKIYLSRGAHFDPEFVDRLIKCLGVYPIGTLVELNTGELAIIRMANHSHPLQPVLLMVADRYKKRFGKPYEVDLKDEVGRWITASKDSLELAPYIEGLTA